MRLPHLVILASLFLSACGYQWVRYEGALGDVRRVAIQTPRNDSFEPGVELLVADAFRREFLRRGALEVVEDPALADLVISAIVLPIDTSSQSFSSVAFSLEYRTRLQMRVKVTRRNGTEVPIDEVGLQVADLYLASADVEVTRKNREEALRRQAEILAGRVHDALFVRISP